MGELGPAQTRESQQAAREITGEGERTPRPCQPHELYLDGISPVGEVHPDASNPVEVRGRISQRPSAHAVHGSCVLFNLFNYLVTASATREEDLDVDRGTRLPLSTVWKSAIYVNEDDAGFVTRVSNQPYGSQVVVLKLWYAEAAGELDFETPTYLLDTALASYVSLPWSPANPMAVHAHLHSSFLADIAAGKHTGPDVSGAMPDAGRRRAVGRSQRSGAGPKSDQGPSPGGGAGNQSVEVSSIGQLQPDEAAGVSSADGDQHIPALTVLFIGDVHDFDGMKAHIVEQIRWFKYYNIRGVFLNTVDANMSTTAVQRLQEAGATVKPVAVSLERSMCPSFDAFFHFANRILPRVRRIQDLPAEFHTGLGPLMSEFQAADAITIGIFYPPDLYFHVLSGLVNPNAARFIDVGARYSFPDPPYFDDADLPPNQPKLPDPDLERLQCSLPAKILENLRPPMPPIKGVQDGLPRAWPFPSDYFVPPSQWVRHQPGLLAAGLPSRPVYPFIDVGAFDPDAVQCQGPTRELVRAGEVDIVIGYAGRLAPEKNPVMLVSAFAHLYRSLVHRGGVGPTMRLVMIGSPVSPNYGQAMLDIARKAGLPTDAVLLTGFIEPDQLPAYISCMDIQVCPSISETFGISAVQAMAMGLPLVHFNVGGLQDYAVHMRNSFGVYDWTIEALSEGLEQLVLDPELRARLGAQARQDVVAQLSSHEIGGLSARIYRTSIAELRVDRHLRLTAMGSVSGRGVVLSDHVADAHTPLGAPVCADFWERPRNSVSDREAPAVTSGDAFESGAATGNDLPVIGPSASTLLVLRLGLASPLDAVAHFRVPSSYLTNDYAGVSGRHLRVSPLLRQRYSRSKLCVAWCGNAIQHAPVPWGQSVPACVPMPLLFGSEYDFDPDFPTNSTASALGPGRSSHESPGIADSSTPVVLPVVEVPLILPSGWSGVRDRHVPLVAWVAHSTKVLVGPELVAFTAPSEPSP